MRKEVWIVIIFLLLVADILVFQATLNSGNGSESGSVLSFDALMNNYPLALGAVLVLLVLVVAFILIKRNV